MSRLSKAEISAAALDFEAAWPEGEAAYRRGEPVSACPHGPGLDNADDAEFGAHMGWLYGWYEAQIQAHIERFTQKARRAAQWGLPCYPVPEIPIRYAARVRTAYIEAWTAAARHRPMPPSAYHH